MSQSMHVIGVGKPDENHRKMYAAYQSCLAAGISIPDEINEYFDWSTPNENGRKIELRRGDSIKEYKADMREGFDVDLSKLPPNITHVRFFVSY